MRPNPNPQGALSQYTNMATGVLILWCGAGDIITRTAHSEALILRGVGYGVDAVRACRCRRYGGSVVLDLGPLTLGSLITFQLYWCV